MEWGSKFSKTNSFWKVFFKDQKWLKMRFIEYSHDNQPHSISISWATKRVKQLLNVSNDLSWKGKKIKTKSYYDNLIKYLLVIVVKVYAFLLRKFVKSCRISSKNVGNKNSLYSPKISCNFRVKPVIRFLCYVAPTLHCSWNVLKILPLCFHRNVFFSPYINESWKLHWLPHIFMILNDVTAKVIIELLYIISKRNFDVIL